MGSDTLNLSQLKISVILYSENKYLISEMDEYDHDDRDQFAKDILKMLERGSPNDVMIKLSDGEIFANKDILMARSEYFSTMFSNNKFIEGETSTVYMTHCSKAVMGKIVKFLSIGAVNFDNLTIVGLLELLHMTKMMLLDKFFMKVEDYVSKHFIARYEIMPSRRYARFLTDLILALEHASQYNLEDIKSFIIERLWISLKDVGSIDGFKSLPFDLLRDILLYDHIDHDYDKDVRPTTKERFDAFMSWLSENENEVTEEQKEEIVESFDFEDFTVEELMTSVRKSEIYPTNKVDKKVLGLFKEQNELLKEKDKLLKEKDKLLKAKDKLLKAKDNLLMAKDNLPRS